MLFIWADLILIFPDEKAFYVMPLVCFICRGTKTDKIIQEVAALLIVQGWCGCVYKEPAQQ